MKPSEELPAVSDASPPVWRELSDKEAEALERDFSSWAKYWEHSQHAGLIQTH